MATLRETFSDIANSIRSKGIEGEIKPTEMASKIDDIEKHHHWKGLDGIAPRLGEDGTLLAPTGSPINFDGVKVVGEAALSGFCQSDLMQGVSLPSVLDLSSIKKVELSGMKDFALSANNINAVYFNNLLTIGEYGLYNAFNGCKSIERYIFTNLETVQVAGLYYAFAHGGPVSYFEFPKLKSIGWNGLNRIFYQCGGNIQHIILDKVESVGQSGLFFAFYGVDSIDYLELPSCVELICGTQFAPTLRVNEAVTRYFLPKVTSIKYGVSNIQSNGTVFKAVALWGNKATEIHFGAKNQAAIEACEGYNTKWGATNATIYFDL